MKTYPQNLWISILKDLKLLVKCLQQHKNFYNYG